MPHLEEAARLKPGSGDIQRALASVYLQLGRHDAAAAVLGPYLDAHPRDDKAAALYEQVR